MLGKVIVMKNNGENKQKNGFGGKLMNSILVSKDLSF